MKAVKITTLDELVESGVVQLTRGKIISKTDMAACPGNFPVYSSARENDGKFGEYGLYMFDEELITWSVDGGGRLFHRPKHKFSVTNVGGILRIRDKSVLDYKYIYYALSLRHSEIVFDWVKKAHPSIIRKLYLDIPLPPLSEQGRVVAFLDEAFAIIAKAKRNAEKNRQNARELFKSYLGSVFANPEDRWEVNTLGCVCDRVTVGHVGITSPHYREHGIRLLRTQNVGEMGLSLENAKYITPEFHASLKKSEVRAGDVLMSRVITHTVHCALIPDELGPANCANVVLVRSGKRLTPQFLVHYIRSPQAQRHLLDRKVGSAQLVVNTTVVRNWPICVPPLSEQKTVVEKLEALVFETKKLQSIYQKKLDALDELKKSILQKAFNGELTEAN